MNQSYGYFTHSTNIHSTSLMCQGSAISFYALNISQKVRDYHPYFTKKLRLRKCGEGLSKDHVPSAEE